MNKLSNLAFILLAFIALPYAAFGQTYTYDNLGRVASVVQPNGTKTVYYYDTVDNRTATQTALSGTTTITPPSPNPVYINVTSVSNLRGLADAQGYGGSASVNYVFTVPSGTTIIGASTGYAIDTGTWPPGASISLVVVGNVYGGGGNGGNGNVGSFIGDVGMGGGDAVYVRTPVTVTVQTGASIKGGGGGGGGGKGGTAGFGNTRGGGGGGGGFPTGTGGFGGSGSDTEGDPGSDGTTAGGGSGGGATSPAHAGVAGGGAGAAGSGNGSTSGAGGAAGYAVRKNGNTVTVSNSGTISGTVG